MAHQTDDNITGRLSSLSGTVSLGLDLIVRLVYSCDVSSSMPLSILRYEYDITTVLGSAEYVGR